MTITIRPDAGGYQRLPDAIGYLHRYIDKGNKAGRSNAILEVQQHSGYEWVFEIWHTKAGYVISIKTKEYIPLNEEENKLGNIT